MIFWRILNSTLYPVKEVENLGFEESEGFRIPDEYLESQNFMVMRTAHGVGDWGIISAMPRLLKQKYPQCKILVPSSILLQKLFSVSHNNAYNIFYNNPYVDKFVDEIEEEVFHDQYRIYSNSDPDIPLIEQMLKFWQFKENEYYDSQPEIYWTKEEKKLGDYIIQKHSKGDFGCLLISDRFGTQHGKFHQESYNKDTKNISNILRKNNIPYYYWSAKPLNQSPFNFINKALNLRHINLRVQLYIKSRAKLNISNQCGTNHIVVRNSKIYESQRQSSLRHNFIRGINYI